jgi:hypothetical protein
MESNPVLKNAPSAFINKAIQYSGWLLKDFFLNYKSLNHSMDLRRKNVRLIGLYDLGCMGSL